jgi:DNA-binding transcriptional ArsR family regulator
MAAKREFRDREDTQVAVLDALVDHGREGMTVLEVRAAVDADIDGIEAALSALKEDGLIDVENEGERVSIYPADRVVPDGEEGVTEEWTVFDALRDRIGL